MRLISIMTCVLALSACATQPEQTLDQKLAGKTPQEKKEVLRLACLNEAEDIGNIPHNFMRHGRANHMTRDSEQTRRLKNICREMTDSAAGKRAALDRECNQELQEGLKTADTNKAEHYKHMKRICKEMTR